jgi:uncharacterized CHY-type Zn-finger protein
MKPEDRDNVVVCPSCQKIFAMTYVLSHRCPFCGGYFSPIDTLAGCPQKDMFSQTEYAQAYKEGKL